MLEKRNPWVLSRWDGNGWQRMGRFRSFKDALQLGSSYEQAMRRKGAQCLIAISQDMPDLVYYTQTLESLGRKFFEVRGAERIGVRIEFSAIIERFISYCAAYTLLKPLPPDRSRYYDPMPDYLRIAGEPGEGVN